MTTVHMLDFFAEILFVVRVEARNAMPGAAWHESVMAGGTETQRVSQAEVTKFGN